MIKGDEGKPMSLMEFISDVPRDPMAYIEYCIRDIRTKQAANAYSEEVVFWQDYFLDSMDDLKRKLSRYIAESQFQREGIEKSLRLEIERLR